MQRFLLQKGKRRKSRNKTPDQDISFSLSSTEEEESQNDNKNNQKSKKKKNRRKSKNKSPENSRPVNYMSEDVASTSTIPPSRNSTPQRIEEERNNRTNRGVWFTLLKDCNSF